MKKSNQIYYGGLILVSIIIGVIFLPNIDTSNINLFLFGIIVGTGYLILYTIVSKLISKFKTKKDEAQK